LIVSEDVNNKESHAVNIYNLQNQFNAFSQVNKSKKKETNLNVYSFVLFSGVPSSSARSQRMGNRVFVLSKWKDVSFGRERHANKT
jgi:hypothetical protein